MLLDESYCPEGITQEDIMGFLTTLITEYESSYRLKHADLSKIKHDINDYFQDVTKEKNKLITEKASAAAAEIIAGAALVVVACTSWVPGINFAVSAGAAAAEATALGLEIAADKLQDTVVEDISNADVHLRKRASFKDIKTYLDAQTSNTKFFPRFQFGITIIEMRAVFIAVCITATKELKKNSLTNTDLKKMFIDWYNAFNDDETLKETFSNLYDTMEANPEDTAPFKKQYDEYVSSVPFQYRLSGVSMGITASITVSIRKGRLFYKMYKSVNSWSKAFNAELAELDADGKIVGAESAESGEMEVLSAGEACSFAISTLAGFASIAFGVLEAVEADKLDDKLTGQISDTKKAITAYYVQLVDRSSAD